MKGHFGNQRLALSAWRSCLICAVLLLAAGCQSTFPGPAVQTAILEATPAGELEQSTPAAGPAGPTPVIEPGLEPQSEETILPEEGQNGPIAVDPLRFIFPNSGPAPVSAWRPRFIPPPGRRHPTTIFISPAQLGPTR
jgi:hypothetical protein